MKDSIVVGKRKSLTDFDHEFQSAFQGLVALPIQEIPQGFSFELFHCQVCVFVLNPGVMD
jgi:hypothetical protein